MEEEVGCITEVGGYEGRCRERIESFWELKSEQKCWSWEEWRKEEREVECVGKRKV